MINTASVLGIAIGSFLGGSLLKLGRRKTVIISQLICIIGAAITMVMHESTLIIGKFLLGLGAGSENVVYGKLITETIPASIMSSFAMSHNASICLGFFTVFFMSAVLPESDNVQANYEDEFWRVIWLGPAFTGIISILLVLFVFRLEPVAYSLMIGEDAEAMEHLKKIYRKKDPDSPEKIDELLDD